MPANERVRTTRHRLFDLFGQCVAQVAASERTDVGVALHRVADAQGVHCRGELLGELIGDGFLDDEAFGGNAALAVVLVARAHGHGRGGVQIGVGENDEGIRAAQLQDLLLELLAGS